MITSVLTLIQKASFISTIYWSMGTFHVSLLLILLLLRLIWIAFLIIYVLHFRKLRLLKIIFSFFRFWFFFIFFLQFFINCFFLLFYTLTRIIFFQFFNRRLILNLCRIIKMNLRILISSFRILNLLFFCFRNSFFYFFSLLFL